MYIHYLFSMNTYPMSFTIHITLKKLILCPLPFCTKRRLCVHVEDFSLQTSPVPWEGGLHTEHGTKLGLTTSWRTSYLVNETVNIKTSLTQIFLSKYLFDRSASIFFQTFANYWKSAYSRSKTQFKLWKSKTRLKQQDFWLLVRCLLFLSYQLKQFFWHLNHQSHEMKTYFSNSSHGNSSMQNMIQAM